MKTTQMPPKRIGSSDEYYTPDWAIEPLIQFLNDNLGVSYWWW